MSDPKKLAQFVAHTLDSGEETGAEQTWIDLVDHGGGDCIVANQCLMSTLGFSDALSHVGVKYLAASPETMV